LILKISKQFLIHLKIQSYEDQEVKLQIWDTAGQEEFDCMTRGYYRGIKENTKKGGVKKKALKLNFL
jgi:hypothetical protein